MRSLKDIFRSHCELDADGKHVNGTDKQSNHNYGDAYDDLLDRESIREMLEIGVADGSSLLAWQEAFPNAVIVGMDIHPPAKWQGEFYLGDQRSFDDCNSVGRDHEFDLIVDDATHQIADTLITLLYMWRYLVRGGLYVIEEFPNIHNHKQTLSSLYSDVQVIDTKGPFGGIEPLVVLRK